MYLICTRRSDGCGPFPASCRSVVSMSGRLIPVLSRLWGYPRRVARIIAAAGVPALAVVIEPCGQGLRLLQLDGERQLHEPHIPLYSRPIGVVCGSFTLSVQPSAGFAA